MKVRTFCLFILLNATIQAQPPNDFYHYDCLAFQNNFFKVLINEDTISTKELKLFSHDEFMSVYDCSGFLHDLQIELNLADILILDPKNMLLKEAISQKNYFFFLRGVNFELNDFDLNQILKYRLENHIITYLKSRNSLHLHPPNFPFKYLFIHALLCEKNGFSPIEFHKKCNFFCNSVDHFYINEISQFWNYLKTSEKESEIKLSNLVCEYNVSIYILAYLTCTKEKELLKIFKNNKCNRKENLIYILPELITLSQNREAFDEFLRSIGVYENEKFKLEYEHLKQIDNIEDIYPRLTKNLKNLVINNF